MKESRSKPQLPKINFSPSSEPAQTPKRKPVPLPGSSDLEKGNGTPATVSSLMKRRSSAILPTAGQLVSGVSSSGARSPVDGMAFKGKPQQAKATASPHQTPIDSGLSDFERAYLERLRNHERPKVTVQFMPTDEIPADADFVIQTQDSTPKGGESEGFAQDWKANFTRRGSMPFMESAEAERLERDLTLPKFKSYYKNIGKSMKSYDATYFPGPGEGSK